MSINDWDSLTSLGDETATGFMRLIPSLQVILLVRCYQTALRQQIIWCKESSIWQTSILKNYSHPTFSTYHPGQLAAINTKASSSSGKQTENKTPKHMMS